MGDIMPDKWNNFEQIPIESPFDIELLQREVGQRFPFYDMKSNINTIAFFCRIDEETLEEKFESLRLILSEKKYIPMIRLEHGEHIIYIIKKPEGKKRKSVWVNIVLLVATVFTTTLAGALQWVDINQVDWINMISFSYLWQGFIFFSIPLLLILGVHEMGHYYASKKHHVDASLPYFIPLPPPFLLGTFGALISTREPIPDRKALLDIGIAGPLCGFLVAIPISLIGFFLMQQASFYRSIDRNEHGSYLTITSPMDGKPFFHPGECYYSPDLVCRMGWYLSYCCQLVTRWST